MDLKPRVEVFRGLDGDIRGVGGTEGDDAVVGETTINTKLHKFIFRTTSQINWGIQTDSSGTRRLPSTLDPRKESGVQNDP